MFNQPTPQDANNTIEFNSPAGTTEEICVLLIQFPDQPHFIFNDIYYYNWLLFDTINPLSLREYYRENSYYYSGGMDVVGFVHGWFTSAHNMAYYGADSPTGIDRLYGSLDRIAQEAISLADSTVDFSQYDNDDDGYVDHLCIVHAGLAQESSYISTDIHSQYCGANIVVDGVTIRRFTIQGEYSPMGVFAHEFGHDLGLVDLYDTGNDGSVDWDGIGYWGLMGKGVWAGLGISPSHLCAYSKMKLGWVDVIEVDSRNDLLKLKSMASPSPDRKSIIKLNIPRKPNEFFLLENRQPYRFDCYLPGSGLLIWHVDENNLNNNDINNKLIDLEEAGGWIQDLDNPNEFNWGDPWDPCGWPNALFDSTTIPNAYANDGSDSGWKVYYISISNWEMTCAVVNSFVTPPPPVIPGFDLLYVLLGIILIGIIIKTIRHLNFKRNVPIKEYSQY